MFKFIILILFLSLVGITQAAPGDVLFTDDFERSSLAPWVTTVTSRSAISTQTHNSGTRSLYTRHDPVVTTSPVIDLSVTTAADLKMWIRRGADSFSEDPDSNEDFIIEYLNSANNWVLIKKYLGSGTKGQIYNYDQSLPSAAFHSGFRIRVRQTEGSGSNYDYWHFDDISITDTAAPIYPSISIKKTSDVLSDNINTSNPKRIPGALLEYTIEATNSGEGSTDTNTVIISDAIPSNTMLYVNDISGTGTGPVRFIDGSPASGLTYTFAGLSSTTDDLSFSNDGGTNFSYTPSPDANGVDSNVTHVRMALKGKFLSSSAGNPSFALKFRVFIE